MKLRIAYRYISGPRRIPRRRNSLKKHLRVQRRAEALLLRHSAAFRAEWLRRGQRLLRLIFGEYGTCTECGELLTADAMLPDMCEACFDKIPPLEIPPEELERMLLRVKTMIHEKIHEGDTNG